MVLIRGVGTLEVTGNAAPKELLLADNAAMTVRCRMGEGIVAQDALTVGAGATVSANFTGLPEKSGAYAVLSDKAGLTVPPLAAATPPAIPEGVAAYLPEDWLSEGKASISIIPTAEDDAYLLASAQDYEWYLTACPANATVRLAADITLEPKAYTAKAEFGGTFDGNGHTLTLPEGATMEGAQYAGIICGKNVNMGDAKICNLTLCVEGNLTAKKLSCGAVVGGCGAYNRPGEPLVNTCTFENLHVRISGTLTAASDSGGAGGVVGDYWGDRAGTGPMRNLRVELLPTAKLNAPCNTTSGRGVGGVLGGAANPVAMENVLVVLHQGATLTSAKQCGGVVAMGRAKYTAKAVSVVDFGATFSKDAPYFHNGNSPTLEDITLFRADAATATAPTGATIVRVETGILPARDGVTVQLLGDTETDRLAALPTSDVWAVEAAEGVNAVKVSPTDSPALNPGATLPLEYAFHAFATAPEGTLWDDVVAAVCTPTMLVDDWAELRDEADYRWYGTKGRDLSLNVRMADDITLTGSTYPMDNDLTTTFDGNGHTLRVPADTTIVNTVEWSYAGCLASVLNGATIRNVTVDFRGKVVTTGEKGKTAGVIVGTTKWGGVKSTFANVRAYIGEGASLQSGWTGAFAGDINAEISASDCVLLDSGVIHGGTLSNDTPTGAKLYTGNTVTTKYSAVDGTYCLGEQEGVIEDGRLALTEAEGLKVTFAKAEGWALTQEGNAVTVSEGSGVCSLTYGLEGFPGVEIPVSFTPMALTLPEGVTATPPQKALLMAKAVEATFPVPAKVAFRTGAKAPTLGALECFEGILRADKEKGELIVGYDFGISKVTVVKVGEQEIPTVVVTVRAQNDLGEPATFAEGAQVNLVRTSDGSPLLEEPVAISPGTTEHGVVCTFPLGDTTEFFRAHIEKASN